MVDFKDIKFYKTDTDDGGGIDITKEIIPSTPNNLFTYFSRSELIGDTTKHKCLYVKNTSIEDMDNFKIWISGGTPLAYTSIDFAFDVNANPYDGAVGFDGIDDYINCTDDANLWSRTLSKFAFAVWIYPQAGGDGNERYVISHGGSSNNSFRLIIDQTDENRIKFIIKDSGGVNHVISSYNLVQSAWNHISCSYDASLGVDNMRIYRNGVLDGVADFTGTVNISSILSLGDSSNDYKGYIKDFKFWYNESIDINEAVELHETNEIVGNPVSYHLQFSEREGTTTKDKSSGIKVATLTNGAFWKLNSQTLVNQFEEPKIYNDRWYNSQEIPPTIGSLKAGKSFPIWVRVTASDPNATAVIDDHGTFTIQFDISAGGTGSSGGTNQRTIKSFNGTSDNIDEPDAAALDLNKFTIAAWFRTTKNYNTATSSDPEGEEGMILIKGRWVVGSEHVNYGMWVTDANGLRGGFESADGTNYLAKIPEGSVPVPNHTSGNFPDPPVNDGLWHLGTVVHDGSNVKVYLDAKEMDSRPTAGAVPETSSIILRVGSNNFEGHSGEQGAQMWFKGDLDDVRVWNTDLDASEITGLKSGSIPQTSNIVYENLFDDAGQGTGGGSGGGSQTVADWKMALAGDWGCEPETDDAINLIKKNGYDIVVGVGDNAYESASCWLGKFNTIKDKMESAFGNHEYSDGGISSYKSFLGYGSTHASVRFQNVLILIIDDNHDIEGESSAPSISSERSWLLGELTKYKNDSNVVWRIVVMHHPWFGEGSHHQENEGDQVQVFHKLLTDNKVNFLYVGHNHHWVRTHQLAYNSGNPQFGNIVASSSPYSRSAPGLIYIVSGTGGHDSGSSLYSLPGSNAIFAYLNKSHNGIHELVATNNGLTLTGKFVDNDGSKFDTFIINA